MVHRSHKKWHPCIKAGEVELGDAYVNPWPKLPSLKEKKSQEPTARRKRGLDAVGKPLSKTGEPFA